MRYKVAAVLLAAIVASGCSTQSTNPQAQDPGADMGQFQLYVSDQPAAIDSFDHLNVTVSQVRVFQASEEDTNSTNSTNSTNTSNTSNTSEAGFEAFNVSETVDLTQLQGDNATSVLEADLEVGNYTKMELEASGINAEVDNSSVDVKLPSGKLQLTKGFTVAANQTTEFVFDIEVRQRGTQGYILRPVISQSGTVGEDVEINRKGQASMPDMDQPEEMPEDAGNSSQEGGGERPSNSSQGSIPA